MSVEPDQRRSGVIAHPVVRADSCGLAQVFPCLSRPVDVTRLQAQRLGSLHVAGERQLAFAFLRAASFCIALRQIASKSRGRFGTTVRGAGGAFVRILSLI